jgi:hypothetical protein
MNIKDLIQSSITNKATDFKSTFAKLMQSKILDKIAGAKEDVGKVFLNKEK